jgi:hypothetical protein
METLDKIIVEALEASKRHDWNEFREKLDEALALLKGDDYDTRGIPN